MRRIYDCFLFDGEFVMLAHRIAELDGVVDQHVLVEGAQTMQGAPKPLAWAEARASRPDLAARIRHISLPRLGPADSSGWDREAFQRNAAVFALQDARPDDLVLILDVDEIPDPELLRRLKRDGLERPMRLGMTRHYEHPLRLGPRSPCCADPALPFATALPRLKPGPWEALDPIWFCAPGVVVRVMDILGDPARGLPPRSMQALRRGLHAAPVIPGAGRHFSYVDPAARPAWKFRRFAHADLATNRTTDPRHLERCRSHGMHHKGWWYAEVPKGPVPADIGRLMTRLAEAGAPAEPAVGTGRLARGIVRNHAARRSTSRYPDDRIAWIDRHFGRVLPLLLPVLALEAVGRRVRRLVMHREAAGAAPIGQSHHV
ncbi:N-acetylglucosaminyltransferase [Tistrella mobilis]